jgi:putative Ca2+/H+ antiporter (TMEM165/GDT1 family)
MIFIAEMGDKTQLVTLMLATRYCARVVLAGIFAATLVIHVASTALGHLAGGLLPADWIRFISGLAFIGFGLWTLRGDSLDGGNCSIGKLRSPFFIVFFMFFCAEIGDKTMLATVCLGSTCSFLPVWIGSTLGMVASDGIAILVGKVLGSRLPERLIKIGAAVIFFAFGLIGVVQGAMKLHPVTWPLGALVIALLSLLFLYRRRPVTS